MAATAQRQAPPVAGSVQPPVQPPVLLPPPSFPMRAGATLLPSAEEAGVAAPPHAGQARSPSATIIAFDDEDGA